MIKKIQQYLKSYKLRYFDFRLLIYVVVLTLVGILVLGSASAYYQRAQLAGMALSLITLAAATVVSYSFIIRLSRILYIFTLLLLVSLFTPLGYEVGGATRWILIGGENGFRFQPSEFAKLFLILYFSAFFARYKEKLNTLRILVLALVLIVVPLFLIYREPNLSTTIIVALIFISLLFIAGLSYKIIAGVLIIGIPAAVISLVMIIRKIIPFPDYQYARIMSWIDPAQYSDNARQQQYSIRAIGSGQLWGKGLHNTSALSVKNANFISEPQTDFIFAIVGEELGFVGCVLIIILLALIVFECIFIGMRAKDQAGRLICCGAASWIGFQSIVNISVTTGLMPNTGQTLPFVSFGLTSLVCLYIIIGIVLNVGLQSRRNAAEDD